MKHPKAFTVLIAAVALNLAAGCGPKRVRTAVNPGQDLIVLLPDDDGTVGRAVVSSPAGVVELASAGASTSVSQNQRPAPVTLMSEREVRRLFGPALSALPPEAQHFVLYFRFESDELTEDSRALVPRILKAAKDRRFPDVGVVGHTDTTGSAAGNIELGLRRANAIRGLLVGAGVDAAVIEVASHGEADLQVKTADEVYEPRNRCVDITVR
jgi:outer membrane protein OmpA-like peptidoglycan-associated protein